VGEWNPERQSKEATVDVQSASDVAGIAVTLILGVLTIFVVNGFRRQLAIRTAEKRIAAYGALWEATYPARPSRWMHEGEVLDSKERRELWEVMSKWYFDAGNGMLMTKDTRSLYFAVKDNLIAELDTLEPLCARQRLRKLSGERLDWERGKLAMDQLSLLRTQMKSDLEIYGRPYGAPLGPEGIGLLRLAELDLERRPWSSVAQ
jgi:hypothetical protein